MDLETRTVDELKNTSRVTVAKLKNAGIFTYWDFLNYFPFRYEDYSVISPIASLQLEDKVTIRGEVISAKNIFTKSGLKMQEVVIFDHTDKITLSWFNQIYLIKLFKKGLIVSASGVVRIFGKKKIFVVTQYEFMPTLNSPIIHTGRIVPIYSESLKISAKTIRSKIFKIVDQLTPNSIAEIYPTAVVTYNHLIDRTQAFRHIHFPESLEMANLAKRRLAFDELFSIQFKARKLKEESRKEKLKLIFKLDLKKEELINRLIDGLPFQLTNAQKRVINDIKNDLSKTYAMNRFLQGDVGSGKTVVAVIAAYISYLNGCQTLFMAPTEILSLQHYQTISSMFKKLKVKIGLKTASNKLDDKNYDIVIGTHALLTKGFELNKIGLVIIDEQHRFGVNQREELTKKGLNPHLLSMTATPIPRTVALTLYANLDMSIIDQMPVGRQSIKTFFVENSKRHAGYNWIKQKIKKERAQIYVICPLIDESETETMKSIKAANQEYEALKKVFSEFNVGLIHGKLKSKVKETVLNDFKNGSIDILVSTSVVEVGIDVPSATIMIIEGAERFGLAQLHQLRGRVGRGDKQSYCFLFTENSDTNIAKRLSFFSRTSNGLELAEYDMRNRGPGELFGQKQHGYRDLKIASYSDLKLIDQTKNAVEYMSTHSNSGVKT